LKRIDLLPHNVFMTTPQDAKLEGCRKGGRARVPKGSAMLPIEERRIISLKGAVARWGAVMSDDQARQNRAANTRRWRMKKNSQKTLAS